MKEYSEDSAVILTSHLISDIENILDEVAFLDVGKVLICSKAEELRSEKGMSLSNFYKEVYKK